MRCKVRVLRERGRLAAPYAEAEHISVPFLPAWSLPIKAHSLVYPERYAQRVEVARFVSWLRGQVSDSLGAPAGS